MPGADVAGYGGQDLYPQSEDEHAKLLAWTQQAFTAADSARRPYYDRWKRYFKLYRSYLDKTGMDRWQSKVFIPYAFSVIETITPKLVAQLPKFLVMPMGPEDVFVAQTIERLLDLGAEASKPELYLQLVSQIKSSLIYGTGLLKTYYDQISEITRKNTPITQPVMGPPQPVLDPTSNTVITDLTGAPMFDPPQQIGEQVVGYEPQRVPFVSYEGPCASWVDIFNFWVAPEADDIDSARYVIERFYRSMSHVMDRIAAGDYHMPPEMGPNDIANLDEEPSEVRKSSINLGSGSANDVTRKDVEIMEFWTDDHRIITVANRKAILRVEENPFDHREKPYIRTVDYLQPGEFWGVGEIEAIEGLQDIQNALINQRVDNVRLAMNKGFAFNENAIGDTRELQRRPGQMVRVTGDRDPRQSIMELEFGDVTASAFEEAGQMELLIERISGASPYQTGTSTDSYNDTATGVSLVQEAGNTKFALKSRMAEIMGLKRLARQWGSLIQQFTSEDRWLRILGPDGQFAFQQLKPDSILGAVDYQIEAASSQQTESVRKQQAMQLLTTIAGIAPQAVPQLLIDLLEAFGKKDLAAYFGPEAQQYALRMAQMQQALSQNAPAQGVPPDQQTNVPDTAGSYGAQQSNVVAFPTSPVPPPNVTIRENR